MKTHYPRSCPPPSLTRFAHAAARQRPPCGRNLHQDHRGAWTDVGNSRGAAWGDYDNDGFIDLFVPQIGPGGIGSARHFLYHNNRDGTFSRITTGPVAAVVSACRGAVWGDYDNDGYLDLVLMNVRSSRIICFTTTATDQ